MWTDVSDADSSTDRLISLFIADLEIGSGISLQNHVKGNGKKHQESPTLKKRANGVSQQQASFSVLLWLHLLFLYITVTVIVV